MSTAIGNGLRRWHTDRAGASASSPSWTVAVGAEAAAVSAANAFVDAFYATPVEVANIAIAAKAAG